MAVNYWLKVSMLRLEPDGKPESPRSGSCSPRPNTSTRRVPRERNTGSLTEVATLSLLLPSLLRLVHFVVDLGLIVYLRTGRFRGTVPKGSVQLPRGKGPRLSRVPSQDPSGVPCERADSR